MLHIINGWRKVHCYYNDSFRGAFEPLSMPLQWVSYYCIYVCPPPFHNVLSLISTGGLIHKYTYTNSLTFWVEASQCWDNKMGVWWLCTQQLPDTELLKWVPMDTYVYRMEEKRISKRRFDTRKYLSSNNFNYRHGTVTWPIVFRLMGVLITDMGQSHDL